MAAVWRPNKFKSVEQLQELIDKYFADCDKDKRPYTITWLAYDLDTTRETLLDYQNNPDLSKFSDTIKKAKLKCEKYAEEYLYVWKNTAGAIFSMVNNYWRKNKQNFAWDKDDDPIDSTLTIKRQD